MYCGGGHLGFPIGIKNRNLVKDIPMIIHLQFGFSQFISFREEDLWNFSHVEYPTGTKNSNFVEDHPRNIPAKFGSNWPSGFGKEAWNVKSLQTTDDGRQVMAIVHLDHFGPGELIKMFALPIFYFLSFFCNRRYFSGSTEESFCMIFIQNFLTWLHQIFNIFWSFTGNIQLILKLGNRFRLCCSQCLKKSLFLLS